MIKLVKKFVAILGVSLLAIGHVEAATQVTFYHHDALGSVIAKSDEDGDLYLNEEYQPYGEKVYGTEDSFGGNEDWYTGKNYSEELDLTYFGARWYDAKQGRFLSIDPAGVKLMNLHTFNRYVYSINNPYKFVDPDGEEVIVSSEMQSTVDALLSKSSTAKSIYDKLHADPRKFDIRSGNDPTGGSALPVRGSTPKVWERVLLRKKGGLDSMNITVNLDPKSHSGFFDENGDEFTSSAERILGHELGHANIYASGGEPFLNINQTGAVDTENRIAKELDKESPVRHRTKGHGHGFGSD